MKVSVLPSRGCFAIANDRKRVRIVSEIVFVSCYPYSLFPLLNPDALGLLVLFRNYHNGRSCHADNYHSPPAPPFVLTSSLSCPSRRPASVLNHATSLVTTGRCVGSWCFTTEPHIPVPGIIQKSTELVYAAQW